VTLCSARGLQLNTMTICATVHLAQMFHKEKRRKYLISNKEYIYIYVYIYIHIYIYIFLQCHVLCFDNIKDMQENVRDLHSAWQ
jgi:hypothetical protein